MFKRQILSVKSICTVALTCVIFSSTYLVLEAKLPPSSVDLPPVIARVSPSIVSVMVEPKKKVSVEQMFNAYGFGNLPEDHPLKNYFRKDFHKFFSGEEPILSDTVERLMFGSGFFITDDGYILTSNHIVEDGASFSVILSDDTELPAKLVGTDALFDLAVLNVQSDRKFIPVEFEDANNIRVGEAVFTIGNPFRLRGTVSAGIVSALDRDIPDRPGTFTQIDAPINQGNSGGPCFNALGHVIGVNAMIVTSGQFHMGVGLIIPLSIIKKAIPSLISKGRVDHGWFGIMTQNLTQELAIPLGLRGTKGSLITAVVKESPADKAGMKVGDVICMLDGRIIKSHQDFVWQIASRSPKEQVKISLCKEGSKHSVAVVLGSSPTAKNDMHLEVGDKELLGMVLQDINDGNKKLVRIVALNPNREREVEAKGIQKGMTIVSVNTHEVSCIKDVERLIGKAKEKKRDSVLLQIKYDPDMQSGNDNMSRFVSLKIDK
ncbi:trypsin-like peptidase domain-containing protein [Candidatus Liberibacter asiaticus]